MGVLETLVEVHLPFQAKGKVDNVEEATADFLKVKETLTRIGIASRKENKLYQSCHILHKQGRYYIVHFKEMFLLDGRAANFEDEDKVRRNLIIKRLEEWKLLSVVNPKQIENGDKTAYFKVIPYKEKNQWELVAKYNVGKVRGKNEAAN